MDILYVLECALLMAREQKRPVLVYLIMMAIIEAGGGPVPTSNDNTAP